MKMCVGVAALEYQIGDYNVLYQIIIALITYIDCNPILCISVFQYSSIMCWLHQQHGLF